MTDAVPCMKDANARALPLTQDVSCAVPINDAKSRSVGALTLTQDEVSRRVRRAVRGFAPPPKAATRQLWRRNVKLWHQLHTHDQLLLRLAMWSSSWWNGSTLSSSSTQERWRRPR